MHVPVKNSERYHWYACEHNIVKLNEPFIEYSHGTEAAIVSVKIVRHCQSHIFVEKVKNKCRNTSVACPSMDEDQRPEHLELRYCEVRSLNCSHTFITVQTNTYMRLVDHAYVIVTITYCHCQQTAIMHFDHADDVCLLFWRHSTADHRLTCLADPDKVAPEVIIIANHC